VEKEDVSARGKAKVRVVSWGRGKEMHPVVDHQVKQNLKIKQKNLQCQINVIAMNVTHVLPMTRSS
jgi:hypothetical protein